MIDIHTHILPGIDDGAKDLEEALQMARMAVREGISTLIATPHHSNGKYDNPGEQVARMVEAFNQTLVEEHIPLKVLTGQEIRITRNLISDLQDHQAITLNNSNYLLLELPAREVPSYTEEILHELRILNITPIIAHPERNMEIVSNPSKLIDFIELGAITQLTSHSINGMFGSKLQKLCFEWCKNHMVHVISTDAHNLGHRPFGLLGAYERISGDLGEKHFNYYLENGRKIVRNEPLDIINPIKKAKKRWIFW